MDSLISTDTDRSENPNETILRLIKDDFPEAKIQLALVRLNVNLNYKNVLNGDSLLHAAIRKCRVDIVRLLINKGADVTIKASQNQTPVDLVKYLLAFEPNNDDLNSIKRLLEGAQPGTSPMNAKGAKRQILYQNDLKPQSSDSHGLHVQTVTPLRRFQIDNEYKASGLKLSLHGVVFQLKLLMLFTHRATKNGYEFRLGTEMDVAEKFDDVVLEYSKPDSRVPIFRFVQAKHKNDSENKRITVNSLESEDDDFSLLKYLISFCKIKSNPQFKDAILSNFSIVTNTGFDFIQDNSKKGADARSEKWRSFMKEEADFDEDEILYFDSDNFRARKYKFSDNSSGELKKFMVINLLESALKTKKIETLHSISERLDITAKFVFLPEIFHETKFKLSQLTGTKDEEGIEKVTKKELIEMANQILSLKEKVFSSSKEKGKGTSCKLDDVLQKLKKRTRDETIDINVQKEDVFSEASELFRKISNEFDRLTDKMRKYADKDSNEYRGLQEDKNRLNEDENRLNKKIEQILRSDLGEIKALIKEDSYKSKISEKLFKELQNTQLSSHDLEKVKEVLLKELKTALEKTISETSIIQVALDDNKFEEYTTEFLEKFRFIINFPSEENLGVLIKSELGDDFNLLNADLACASFEREMLEFFKSYHKGTAEFFTQRNAHDLFVNLKRLLDTLMISGLGKSYPEKLRQYEIRFEVNLVELIDFLSNQNQIFHLVTQSTRLGAIKVLQTLDDTNRYKKEDSLIFMRLRTILRKETQRNVLSAIGKRGTYDLIVIEIQSKKPEKEEADELHDELNVLIRKLLENRSWKKIVVIDSKERSYMFEYQTNYSRVMFQDFDGESKKKFLERDIDFQGTNARLDQLMDIDSSQNVLNDINMECLLDEPSIKIGDERAFSSVGFVKNCYIDRQFRRRIIRECVLQERSELFFITGANRADLLWPEIVYGKIMIYESSKRYENGIVIPPEDQIDHEMHEKIFEKLGENAHWLEYYSYWKFCGFVWKDSKTYSPTLMKYAYKDNMANNKMFHVPSDQEDPSALDEEYLSKTKKNVQKIIIVANDPGMGKSTTLTSLAGKMKAFDNTLYRRWIVRINLNDYAEISVPQSLNQIDFNETDTEKAIDFITKVAIPDELKNDNFLKLQQNLFKLGLNGFSKNEHVNDIENQGGHRTMIEKCPEGDENINEYKIPKIVLMFDGFDEITPSYRQKMTTLIKALNKSQVSQMWITTRVHEKDHLEKELQTLANVLMPLSEDDQMKLSTKLWKWNLKFVKDSKSGKICERTHQDIFKYLKEAQFTPYEDHAIELRQGISDILEDHQDISDILNDHQNEQFAMGKLHKAIDDLNFFPYAQKLIKNWKKSIGDRSIQFTVNPLQLKMLAEVIFARKFHLPKDFGLFDLYNEFIAMKFDIYYDEKEKRRRGNQGADESRTDDLDLAHKIHCVLAVELLFPDDQKPTSLPNFEDLKKLSSENQVKMKLKLARRGILCLNEGRLEFIHRSFAEYFFSKYIIDNIGNKVVQEVLLPEILAEDGYQLIREFLNGHLVNVGKNIEIDKTTINLMNKRFAENKMFFRSYVEEGHHAIFELTLNAIQNDNVLFENLLTQTHDKPIIEYAVDRGHSIVVKQILEASLRLKPDIVKNKILKCNGTYTFNENILSKAIQKNNVNVVKTILNFVIQTENVLGKDFLVTFLRNVHVENALIKAILEKKFQMVKSVIKSVVKVNEETHLTHLFRTNYEQVSGDQMKFTANFLTCIMRYPRFLTDFVFECDRNGKNIVYNVLGMDYIKKKNYI